MKLLTRERLRRRRLIAWALPLMAAAGAMTTTPARAQADAVSALRVLREGGCGGLMPATAPLRAQRALDWAAGHWARGGAPAAAAAESGYAAEILVGLHITGPEAATLELLKKAGCRKITDPGLHDLGLYRRGTETWLLLAGAVAEGLPAKSQAPALAVRALALVNDIRARGARCGERSFSPVAPVRLSGPLSEVAMGHAADMAAHDYFEHADLAGHSPADRVRAVGYREFLVGENIAYGPKSAEEVVQGWLDSPGHCENLMDARFAEMGIAYAAGRNSKPGLYWVQVLAAPRA